MWGQDLFFFLTLNDGALAFWPDFRTAPSPLIGLLAIPQGWTLGVEFSFYAIAPFIVRRSVPAIAAALAASLFLRLLLQFAFGYNGGSWSYQFFPSELAVFLLGALGYCVYKSAVRDRRLLGIFAVAIVSVGVALLVNRWHGLSRIASVSFLMLAVAAIPFLFRSTKDDLLDRHLGELSYPIYICHFLVIWFLDRIETFGAGTVRGVAIIATTLVVSWALYWWVDRPIDSWRQRRFEAKRASYSVRGLAEQPGLAPVPRVVE
jgi:peptidoglycan/LPS O-acetylase OafA/YrhL